MHVHYPLSCYHTWLVLTCAYFTIHFLVTTVANINMCIFHDSLSCYDTWLILTCTCSLSTFLLRHVANIKHVHVHYPLSCYDTWVIFICALLRFTCYDSWLVLPAVFSLSSFLLRLANIIVFSLSQFSYLFGQVVCECNSAYKIRVLSLNLC